jgi:hypothetical protein
MLEAILPLTFIPAAEDDLEHTPAVALVVAVDGAFIGRAGLHDNRRLDEAVRTWHAMHLVVVLFLALAMRLEVAVLRVRDFLAVVELPDPFHYIIN